MYFRKKERGERERQGDEGRTKKRNRVGGGGGVKKRKNLNNVVRGQELGASRGHRVRGVFYWPVSVGWKFA